ncbi:klhl36 [Symbiodinium microadriaticum]|nr:klhl36 [Symbiodinium microadriaticum]
MAVLGELRKGKGGVDWTVTCSYLESILSLIKTTTAGKSHGIVVHQEVARMWESFREMTSTHNVIFESSEGEVSAHDQVLMISSPVLKAMLETSMKEGSCRRIDIKDSSSRGISLFLDLLYTSSSAIADLDYKTMLVALDLAHRWQVQHIVDMLANSLQQEINAGSFGEIAESATLKSIEPLQKACITFGSKNADVQAMLEKNSFPPAVAKLMGMSEADRAEATTSKRRRFSCYLTRPKPFIPVLGKPMISWVVDNLSLQADDSLIIIFNPSWMSMKNFMQEILADKDSRIRLVELPGPTRGAAETVLIGLQALPQELRTRPTLLADGDTFYTSDVVGQFRKIAATHNAVFCFHDTQPKPIYSYITMDDADNIKEVKEKVKISDWANTGCYCFRDGAELAKECEALIKRGETQLSQDQKGEFYTSGVIAAMISRGAPFKGIKLYRNDFHVLGTPTQVGDLEALQRVTPADYDWFGYLSKTQHLPLVEAMTAANAFKDIETHVKIVSWMVKGGPAKIAQSNVSVPQSVVDTWEAVREMTSTHNVVFQTADGEVSAHDFILVTTSPVLRAMLDSTMKEGLSKRIPVKDSSGSGVRLFVDLLYTSSTGEDPNYQTMLVALDLAHRWQVNGVVSVLAGMLSEMIAVNSFPAIAEAAMLKGLEKGTLPAEVRKLLGVAEWCSSWPNQPKMRFLFDLQGTLLTAPQEEGNLRSCRAIERNVKLLRRLKAQGHHILIWTESPAESGAELLDALRRLGVEYNELHFGKPVADFYIDDRGVDPLLGDLDKQIGFYPTAVKVKEASPEIEAAKLRVGSAVARPKLSKEFLLGMTLGLCLGAAAGMAAKARLPK